MFKTLFPGSLLILILGLLVSGFAFAGDQSATFDAFYRPEWNPPLVFATIGAVVVAALLYVGLFPVTGPVTLVGTSIGGMMGLSGAAATNAGLALLGGGSLVSGGLGVMGGAALLAAAISFGTDIVIDYAAGNVLNHYEYRKFAESSWKMMNLPLPKNTSGPDSVQSAGKELESSSLNAAWACIKEGKPISVTEFKNCLTGKEKTQRQLVRNALVVLNSYKSNPEMSLESAERKSAMYALLHFLNNDYVAAKKSADESYSIGLKVRHTPTLPAFISSASTLYDNQPDFKRSFSLFRYSVLSEPANPLTPVLFSSYLDRLSFRLNDGAASLNEVDRIAKLAFTLYDDDRKLAIQQILLSHYFMQIKVAQQRVISLTGSQNKSVRQNPRTLAVINGALNDYDRLLKSSKNLIDRQKSLMGSTFKTESMWDDVKSGKNPFGGKKVLNQEQGWSESLWTFSKAWAEYSRNQPSMIQRAASFEKEIAVPLAPAESTAPSFDQHMTLLDWVKGLFR